jgi:hypothetical protein
LQEITLKQNVFDRSAQVTVAKDSTLLVSRHCVKYKAELAVFLNHVLYTFSFLLSYSGKLGSRTYKFLKKMSDHSDNDDSEIVHRNNQF